MGRSHNFHVPLTGDLHRALREEAARSGQAATEIAREAIRELLKKRRKKAVAREIAAYASKTGGGTQDLDTDLEAASVEHLIDAEDHGT
jgi:hypothetical protein